MTDGKPALLDVRAFAAEVWPDEAWREGIRQRAHNILDSEQFSPHVIQTRGGRRYVPRWVVDQFLKGDGR